MARKSRVNVAVPTPVTTPLYNTAIYARLSVEDGERESLENQVCLIENYIERDPQLIISGRYIDNGLSGRTFEREAFCKMMDDVRARKINCIVVKDLSRFSRSYIEAGEFLEKIFPFMGIRFISVNDDFDSFRDDPTDIIIMFKNLINSEYSDDLSQKIIAVFKNKRKNGEYLGARPVYGYKRSIEHKNRLEIDEEAAQIVRDIFRWKREGLGHSLIVRRLNEMNIPSPSKRLRDAGNLTSDMKIVTSIWGVKTITDMLKNSTYIGRLVQGKRKIIIYEGKRREIITPESEWDIVDNAHPPIIDMETWDCVQAILEQRRKQFFENHNRTHQDETENVFKGLIICGNCGTKMYRRKDILRNGKLTYNYACYVRKQNNSVSRTTKTIRDCTMNEIVHKIISEEIKRTVDMKALIDGLSKDRDAQIAELKKLIASKNKRISQLRVHRMSITESLAIKRITEDEYVYAKSKYEAEEIQLRQEIATLENQLNDESLSVKNKWLTSFQRFMNEKIITREMAVTLIQKIVVHDKDHIDVSLNFREEYNKLIEYTKEVASK